MPHPADDDDAYGDTTMHPLHAHLQEMQDIEEEHGINPDAWLPRFFAWLRSFWD